MPINLASYPADWNTIAKAVKDAANWQCEYCGIKHGSTRISVKGKEYKVILTAAHIGENRHDKMDCSNLKALCQVCHLREDHQMGGLVHTVIINKIGAIRLWQHTKRDKRKLLMSEKITPEKYHMEIIGYRDKPHRVTYILGWVMNEDVSSDLLLYQDLYKTKETETVNKYSKFNLLDGEIVYRQELELKSISAMGNRDKYCFNLAVNNRKNYLGFD